MLSELEHIDDDCDQKGIAFIKINNAAEAKEYGIDKLPALIYFENKIPAIYGGNSKFYQLNPISSNSRCWQAT